MTPSLELPPPHLVESQSNIECLLESIDTPFEASYRLGELPAFKLDFPSPERAGGLLFWTAFPPPLLPSFIPPSNIGRGEPLAHSPRATIVRHNYNFPLGHSTISLPSARFDTKIIQIRLPGRGVGNLRTGWAPACHSQSFGHQPLPPSSELGSF